MITHLKESQSTTNKSFTNIYVDISKEKLESEIDNILYARGYVNKTGGTYVRGKYGLRLLLGAMYKYFKFQITVTEIGNGEIEVTLASLSSGMSGGIIGVNQVKTEVKNIEQLFQLI